MKWDENNKPEWYLTLMGEGLSAKCPPGIFGEGTVTIPNNGKDILEQIVKFAA